MSKLWSVSIVKQGFVFADTEEEALRQQHNIERWEDAQCEVEPFSGDLMQWPPSALVYHAAPGDMTLADAIKRHRGQ